MRVEDGDPEDVSVGEGDMGTGVMEGVCVGLEEGVPLEVEETVEEGVEVEVTVEDWVGEGV